MQHETGQRPSISHSLEAAPQDSIAQSNSQAVSLLQLLRALVRSVDASLQRAEIQNNDVSLRCCRRLSMRPAPLALFFG